MIRNIPAIYIDINIKDDKEVKQSKYNFNKKSVKNMEDKALKDRKVGDFLLNKANELSEAGDLELSQATYTHAGRDYIEAIEKVQKTVLSASGKEREKFTPDNSQKPQKLIKTHSNRALQSYLSDNGVELISKEEAARVDLAGGAKYSAYIEARYSDLELDKSTCEDLKKITDKAFDNLNKLKEDENKDTIKKNVLRIVEDLITSNTK